MKLKNNTLFVICALSLCFPIGLLFLIRSDKYRWQKYTLGLVGAILFFALLLTAFIRFNPPPMSNTFDLIVTRKTLSIGQSGGLCIANDVTYYTDFNVSTDNDCLTVKNNIYTAVEEGVCTLSVFFNDQIRTISITITGEDKTDEFVYASPTGERYHSNAKHAGKTAIKMTEEDALQSQKTPCKICWNNKNP